jgi:hypothetical protein
LIVITAAVVAVVAEAVVGTFLPPCSLSKVKEEVRDAVVVVVLVLLIITEEEVRDAVVAVTSPLTEGVTVAPPRMQWLVLTWVTLILPPSS